MRSDARSAEAQAWRGLYRTKAWQALRLATFLRDGYRCQMCGRTTGSPVCDHITAHKGDDRLFHDPANLATLCAPCHDAGKQKAERAGYSGACDASGWPVDPRHLANRRS